MTAIQVLPINNIRTAWVAFLTNALGAGWTVILSNEDGQVSNSPRPPLPYVTVKLDGLSELGAVPESRIVPGVYNPNTGNTTNNVLYRGERVFTAMLQFFGVNAQAFADAVRLALIEPERRLILQDAGVFPRNPMVVRNITSFVGTMWEQRSAFDVLCGLAGTVVTSPGTIETVEGDITALAGTETILEPFTGQVGA